METSAIKVLLIDDEPDLLDLSKQFLELDQDISTDTAASAVDALTMGIMNYNVIVSDYQMPGKDGIQLLKEIRASGNQIPFILFTGKGREDIVIEALNNGADFYLQKGGDPSSQFAELSNMIKQAHARKIGEHALTQSEIRYRTLFENSINAVLLATNDGKFIAANPSACLLFGINEDVISEIRAEDLIIHDENWESAAQELEQTGKAEGEFTFKRNNGATFIGETTIGQFKGIDGSSRVSIIVEDATEANIIKERLKSSEEKYRRLFETGQDGILIIDYETETIIDANKFLLDLIGQSLDSTYGKHLWELGFIEDRTLAEKAFFDLKKNGYVRYENIPLRAINGEILPVDFIINVYKVDETKVVQCNIRDIKERQIKEKRQKELTEVIDSTNDAVIGLDINGVVISWNNGARNIFGYGKDEMIGRPIALLASQDDENDIMIALAKISRGELVNHYETKRLKKGGGEVDISITTSPTFNEKGCINGISIIASDITRRRRVDDELRESERRYRQLVEFATEAIVVVQDGMLCLVNPMAVTLSGFSEQELISKHFSSLVHTDDRARLEENFEKRLRGETSPVHYNLRIMAKDGNVKWTEIRAVAIDWRGRPASLNFLMDITDCKRAEEEKRSVEERLNLIMDNITDAIWFVDMQFKLVWMSNLVLRDGGFTLEELNDMPIEKQMSPDSYQNILSAIATKLTPENLSNPKKEISFRGEIEYIRKDGSGIWYDLISKLLRDGLGQPIGILMIGRDITKRIRVENTLKESESRFERLTEQSEIVIWEIDADGLFTYVSHASELVWGGYLPDELVNKKHFYDLIPDAERESFSTLIFEKIKARERFVDLENPVRTKDGRIIWVSTNGIPILNTDGTLRSFQGSDTDITEHKKAEKELHKSEKKYRLIANNMADVVSVMDLDLRLTYISPSIKGLRGFTAEEAMGQSLDRVLTPGSMRLVLSALSEEMELEASGKADPNRTRLIELEEYRKDGSIIWVSNNVSFMRNENGQPMAIVVVARDITELKETERKLEHAAEQANLKLEHMLSPDHDIEGEELADIINAQEIQSFMDDFYMLTNIGIAIIDVKGNVLVANGWQDICTRFHRVHPETRHNCIESDLHLTQDLRPGEYRAYRCKNGMWDIATPIFIGQKHVGNIFFGQFFFDDEVIDTEFFAAQAEKCDFDKEEYLAALAKVPRWSKERINRLMDFYSKFATMVSHLSYSNLKLAKTLVDYERTEEALRESVQRYELVMDGSSAGLWDSDVANKRIHFSPHWKEMRGYTDAEIGDSEMEWRTRIHPDDAPRVIAAMQAHFEGKTDVYEAEYRVRCKNGSFIWVLDRGKAIRDATGQVIRNVGSEIDITERKRVEEALRHANIKLGILSTITRHDINNQMMVVNGFLQLCKLREKDPDLVKYLDKMSNAAANMLEQIAFTKDYQELGIHAPAWASVGRRITQAFDSLHPIGVVLEDKTDGVEVLTDPMADKVPYNLVENSMRHGGQVTRIKMSAEQVGDSMMIVYEDDGVGISAEDKKRLFQKGFGKNTGYGLFLIREILAITGITIEEKGQAGKGVHFEMLVPPGAWRHTQNGGSEVHLFHGSTGNGVRAIS